MYRTLTVAPVAMQVTSSTDAASTHEGHAQGISSGWHSGSRHGALQGGAAGAASAMMPYEACFSRATASGAAAVDRCFAL